MISEEEQSSVVLTWGILSGIAVGFLLWGLFIFFLIGNKGPPAWDFSAIPDIPGESAYSTFSPTRPQGLAPDTMLAPPEPQHVMGPGPEARPVEAPFK